MSYSSIPYFKPSLPPQCTGGYLFGFNGMESEPTIYGEGNAYDFGARMYDGRIGRWWSVDPWDDKYAEFSPYTFVANSPLRYVDPNGKNILPVNDDAVQLLDAAVMKYGLTRLVLTDAKGVVRNMSPISGKDAITYSNQLKKALKKVNVKLKKHDIEEAFVLYSKIAELEVTELAVYQKGEDSLFTNGKNVDAPGTIQTEGDSPSTNENYIDFAKDFERDQQVLDEVTEGKSHGETQVCSE